MVRAIIVSKTMDEKLGLKKDSLKKRNTILIFTLSYVFSFLIAFFLQFIVIHQTGFYASMLDSGATELSGDTLAYYTDFMAKYGANYRTFKHGALHGVLAGLFLVLPILASQSIFERKSVKYVAINAGYCVVTMALMGGIICQW